MFQLETASVVSRLNTLLPLLAVCRGLPDPWPISIKYCWRARPPIILRSVPAMGAGVDGLPGGRWRMCLNQVRGIEVQADGKTKPFALFKTCRFEFAWFVPGVNTVFEPELFNEGRGRGPRVLLARNIGFLRVLNRGPGRVPRRGRLLHPA